MIHASELLISKLSQQLVDPDRIKKLVFEAYQNPQLSAPEPPWKDLSLYCGYPSLLLASSTLQSIGMIDESIPHLYVLKIKEILETDGISDLSLFGGVTGVCVAIQYASCGGQRYLRMLESLHNWLFDRIDAVYLQPLWANQKNQDVTFSSLYDIVQGIAGIGRYLLEFLDQPNFEFYLEKIVASLVGLSQPFNYHGHAVPGWALSPHDYLNYKDQNLAHANFNMGLSHGIPGVLALLSMVKLRGIRYPGLSEAIERIATWIKERSFLYEGAIRWSTSVSWDEEIGLKPIAEVPCHDAWCYGVPGVARSLFLGGKALKNDSLKSFAKEAFYGIFLRDAHSWGLPGPGICHGIGGLLLVTSQMAKEEGCGDLSHRVSELEKCVTSFCKEDYPLGIKDYQPTKSGNYLEVDNPGFLEGATGTLCALLSASNSNLQSHLPFLI